VHSLYPVPLDKELICTETHYGTTFASAIANKNVFGTQFHPEKSGDIGLRILENFARIAKK
jgi:glutamine amidotransferase